MRSNTEKALRRNLEKQGSHLGAAAKGIGVAIATGIAYNLAGDAYNKVRHGLTKSRSFKNMMSETPDLKDLDKKMVQKAFNTLHTFNPEYAADPLVAGQFVQRMARLPEMAGDVNALDKLVGSHNSITSAKRLQIPNNLPIFDSAMRKATLSGAKNKGQSRGDSVTEMVLQRARAGREVSQTLEGLGYSKQQAQDAGRKALSGQLKVASADGRFVQTPYGVRFIP